MKLKKVLGCVLSLGMLISPMNICAEEDAGVVAYSMDENDHRTFNTIIDAWDAACDGTLVYLNKDWEISSRLILYSGNNATLDLNGHSITRMLDDYESDGEVIYMNENSSLTLKGSTERKFTFVNYRDKTDGSDYTWEYFGGIITGGKSKNGAGGIHMKANSVLNLDHVGVVGNKTGGFDPHGGGIQMDGDNCTVNLNNGAKVSYNYSVQDGGGIYVAGEDGNINLNNSQVSFNKAAYGGGIHSNYDATYITLENHSNIHNNRAYSRGGGLYFVNSYNHITSNDSTGRISGNVASGNDSYSESQGGGIYYCEVDLSTNVATVKGITFDGNIADTDYEGKGGAIFTYLDNIEITNCTFTNNKAKYGGAAYLDGEKIKFADCSLTDNTCSLRGGAIYVDSLRDVYLSGKVTVKNNKKKDGSANDIYLQNGIFSRAYVSGTPSAESEVGLYGEGDCKVGINQTEDNGTFFLDQSSSYHLSYDDGKLYQKNGATGSIFGSGNTIVAVVVLVCVVGVGFIVYRKKRSRA